MTDRLKTLLDELEELNAEDLEQVSQRVEMLARARNCAPAANGSSWKFDWVGALRDQPEQTGVEGSRRQSVSGLVWRGKESA